MTRNEDESLADYAKRIAAKLEESENERRRLEPRFDLECAAYEKLLTLGLENVGDSVIALNGDVTAQHSAKALELPCATGFEVRVVSYHYSQAQVSYADMVRLRESRDVSAVERATEHAVRQLMVAQRAEAQAWLDANPEETRKGFEHL